MQVYNFCLLGFVLIDVKIFVCITPLLHRCALKRHSEDSTPPKTQPNHYLWPNLQLNTKSNPLFKHIQIDLYDPLRIQHESLPHP
eukprot:jgi/Chrzof1/5062/Cz15g10120.t1